jgi:hypothetical protein
VAVDSAVAVGIGPGAVENVTLTAMEAGTTASDVRRVRKVSGPRTRTARPTETDKTTAGETGRGAGQTRKSAKGRGR